MGEHTSRLSTTAVATILSGAAVSDAIDLKDYVIAALMIPSAWTAAALTFTGCDTPGGAFLPLYDDAGTEVTVASASVAADRILVNKAVLEQLAAVRWLKIRSGVLATPVNQAADRVIKVMLKS